MSLTRLVLIALFITLVTNFTAVAGSSGSFSKTLQQGKTIFTFNSKAILQYSAQIVSVSVQRDGKKLASLKLDVDCQADSAQLADLNGDGTPELVVFSKRIGAKVPEALDVYWLDGKSLRHSAAPSLENESGYRGGDSFHLQGRLLVRTVPMYMDGDAPGKPTGGTRVLKYDFKDGAFVLYVQSEKLENLLSSPEAQSFTPAVESPILKKPAADTRIKITEVVATESGIAIKTSGIVSKHKVMNLENPERIAVDIYDADSPLVGKRVAINRFDISRARIGRNKGFLRIALDTSLTKFPKYEVKSSDSGLIIEFAK